MLKINEGDRVIDLTTDRVAEVKSVYPEINMIIVEYETGVYGKVSIDNVYRYGNNIDEPERKKASLLDKIKGCFR